ncbi:LAGLIDADG family homing endonuclease [Rhodococcus qingshengii]|uniref:LAGLIDADG family homing endonuclease n=1 Tax=Rhodococcus qingshengii TaxID=334542 RepID=UPI0035DDC9CE
MTDLREDLNRQGAHCVQHLKRIRTAAEWTLHIGGDKVTDLMTSPDDRAVVNSLCVGEDDPGWTIETVRRIEDGLVQCIQVDAPDSLYLCGKEMIPTHNSMIASVIACWWVSTRPVGEAIVVSCYTDDTEVLTRDGWKLFKDVHTGPEGDEFATRNPKTKQFEWQHAFKYYEAPWDGEIVDVRGRSLDLRVTPNHRMAVQWSTYSDGVKTTGETFKRADAIGPRGAELPALSEWEGKTPETVTFGSYTWDTLDFAAFLGAWIAEGSLGPRRTYTKKGGYGGSVEGDVSSYSGTIVLTQLPETKGYEPYRDLLVRMLGREPCRNNGKDWVFACSELYEYLSVLGSAHEKYIPADIKNWGRDALEKFLEFYLLGDGWFQKSQGRRASSGYGSWRSCTVSKRLADDLQEIAQKVGRHATITIREPRDGGTFEGGRKILKENCRTSYYLIFGDAQTRSVKTSRSHYRGNVYCVSVPNETLYVRRGGSPIWCGNTAPTYSQVNKILWEEIRSHHRKALKTNNPLPGRVTQGDEWKSDDGTVMAFGRKPPDGDRHAFHGIHRRYVLVVVDEACGVPEEIWTGAEAITTSDACRILAIGNPDDRQTEFGKAFLDPTTAQDWNRISVPASITPNFTGEPVPRILNEVLVSKSWCEERLRNWGKDDPRYISKVLAKFPEQSKSSLFPPALIASATDDVAPQPFGGVLRLGVDVARFGTDANVVVSYHGNTARIEQTWSGTDTVSSAYQVLDIAKRIKEEKHCSWVEIRVDAVGLGAGVVDTLNARAVLEKDPWFSVYEMHGSASPPVDVGGSVHGYGNARAYWFDQLRQSMRNRRVQIENDQRIVDDLGIVFYKFSNGKLFIISKEEMRKLHGRSPDFADALAYATSPVVDSVPSGTETTQDAQEAMDSFMGGMDDSELSIAPF